jgi:hypothetical protein
LRVTGDDHTITTDGPALDAFGEFHVETDIGDDRVDDAQRSDPGEIAASEFVWLPDDDATGGL